MAQVPRSGPRTNTVKTISCTYYIVVRPVLNSQGQVTRVTLEKAQTTRPTSMISPGALVIECEDEFPVDLFTLKSRAKLAVETDNAIKSLRQLRDELTGDVF